MRTRPSLFRGITTGLAAGIAATLIMDQFLKLAQSGQKVIEKQQKLSQGKSESQIDQEWAQKEQKSAQQEDSTEILARRVAETAGKQLSKDDKKTAGHAVHYTFGTLMGVVYCVTAEYFPEAASGGGTAFGTLLFLGADAIAVPALRLAPPPTQTAPVDHLEHWAAHVVYGASLQLVRSLVHKFV